MFGMSISSVSSIVTKKTASSVSTDLAYSYYTFDQADVDGTNVLNRVSTFYDASLSAAGLLDSSNNISGTTDLSLNASTANQFVTINSPMDIGKSTGMSILLWVRYGTDISSGTRIFDFGNDPASDNIEMFIDDIGIPMINIYSGSTPYAYSFGYPLNINLYKHLGITMAANGTFNYYIDGVLYKTTTGNQYPADIVRTKNYIGKSSNNARFYNGGIGEIRIYNNVVSSAVVLNNMNTNVRLYTNSFMTHNYGFKYSDLQNGLIKNLATGVYDASFLAPPATTFNINSGPKQLGITTGTQKFNRLGVPVIINSRRNSNFLYNIPTQVITNKTGGQSVDWNYGIRILSGFTSPATRGFTINFFFYFLDNPNTYDLPYFSFSNGNDRALAFGANGINNVTGATSGLFWLNQLWVPSNPKPLFTLPTAVANTGWYQYSLVVDYDAQTIKSYINLDSYVYTHDYFDFSNITFANFTLMNEIYYQGYEYNRPIRGFMDDFRIYNVPLQLRELRQLAQVPVIPGSRSYTLRQLPVAAPVNGNVAIYMDRDVSRIYLSEGVGNLYVGNIAANTWTQSTLAVGSPGQLENRNWRDIVCDGTGQYVVACVRTTLNDPSGTVFYSSDYGNTYTQTASVIDTSYCFNLAMSDNGNYTYMTAWGVPTPLSGNNANTQGNLFTSLDKGVTWTRITGVTSWTSVVPSQVRCNSTGEYVVLGVWGSITTPICLSNYGQTLLTGPATQVTYGMLTANPVLTNRASDNALILSTFFSNPGSGKTWRIAKAVSTIVTKIAYSQECTNVPMNGGIAPQTATFFPWSGARNICAATDRKTLVMVDTAGLGNVFVSTNGLATAPWPESGGTTATSCLGDVINLSIPNVVSQTPVPRSAWSGVCVNYTDHFAFANKTGTVYIYSWTLQ